MMAMNRKVFRFVLAAAAVAALGGAALVAARGGEPRGPQQRGRFASVMETRRPVVETPAPPAQAAPTSRFPSPFAERAAALLASPYARMLSGSAQTALGHLSGRIRMPNMAKLRERARLRFQPGARILSPGAARMVNSEAEDQIGEPFDISTQSETAVAGMEDTVVVLFNDSLDFALTGNSFVGFSVSNDGGETFHDQGAMPTSAFGINLGDPGLAIDRAGNFYASSISFDPTLARHFEFTVAVNKSTNGGLTFAPPVFLPPGGVLPNSFSDKEFIAVDATRGPHAGNVYVSFTSFPPGAAFAAGAPIGIFFSRSTDGGQTFSVPIRLSGPAENGSGSAPAVGPDGTVYVAWEDFSALFEGPGTIVVAKSADGGATFGAPVKVTDVQDIGFFGGSMLGNFRVNSFPRIAVNPRNGHVYITYASNPQTGDSGDVFFTRSADAGASWSAPVRVNDDDTPNDQWFPAIAVNRSGEVEIIWYDKRRDPANLRMDLFSARSVNDGISFLPNRRVTRVSFPPAVGYDPIVVSTYMGDYIDIQATRRSNGSLGEDFLLAWGDFRKRVVSLGGTRHDQDVAFTRSEDGEE